MQSENFDKKIKEVLSQRPPGNEKQEWDKMEKLLDVHLPVKKDDRRRILFIIIFLFLLTGGGAFLIFRNSGTEQKISQSKAAAENLNKQGKESVTDNTNSGNRDIQNKTVTSKPYSTEEQTTVQKTKGDISLTVEKEKSPLQQKPNYSSVTRPEQVKNITGITTSGLADKQPKQQSAGKNRPTVNKTKANPTENVKIISSEKNDLSSGISPLTKTADQKAETANEDRSQQTEIAADKPGAENKSVESQAEEIKTKEPESVNNEPQPKPTANAKKENKGKGSFGNKLFFVISAGTDFSSVGLGETGKLQPVLGAGIGYQFSKKLAVRTGFYTARKVYKANPEDYNPPPNFWNYYPNLKSIEADCKVYEIPVVIDYTISQNKKQSWFASAGLSTLLMKKETYEYYFKPASSPTYISYTRTISNQNKHYFSILDVSGGLTRKINKNISLRAEPYAKFALSGVGYGKVKLNSGGILVSAIMKPFARK